tara:strand:+ start:419 stop:622 length:204 start_codon:yes stop_codon:yes gene_type:complete
MKIWLFGWAEYILVEIAFRIWDCGEADYGRFDERAIATDESFVASLNFRVGRLFYCAGDWVGTLSDT